MSFKIEGHVLVPVHKKLNEKDKKQLLDRYGITIKELPKIFKKDSALQGLDVATGDVIKITRKSQTTGESDYYRVVIRG